MKYLFIGGSLNDQIVETDGSPRWLSVASKKVPITNFATKTPEAAPDHDTYEYILEKYVVYGSHRSVYRLKELSRARVCEILSGLTTVLKTCPFCGHDVMIEPFEPYFGAYTEQHLPDFKVECSRCKVGFKEQGSKWEQGKGTVSLEHEARQRLQERWNERVIDEELCRILQHCALALPEGKVRDDLGQYLLQRLGRKILNNV